MITVDTTLSGRYRLEALLGRGGMADVYRARDLVLERPVAVKVVRATGEEDARRFAREVRTMAALSHPGIVQLFDAGTHEEVPYLVMELVEGAALPSLLPDEPLDAGRVAIIGKGLARALAHAHELGIIHRDVKPANVLLDADGRVRLSDFGIARLADATRLTTPGMTSGSAGYLAPEQLQGDDVGPGADVYALGLVLLEALTGRREYTGTPVEAAMARLGRDPEVPEDLPEPWTGLLRAMTAREPARRPSAEQVAAWLSGQPPPEEASSEPTVALRTADLPDGPAPEPEPQPEPEPRPEPEPQPEPEPDRSATPRQADPRRRVIAGTVALLTVAAVVVVLGLGNLDGPAPEDPADPGPPEAATTLPPDLDEAIDRLEEAVRP